MKKFLSLLFLTVSIISYAQSNNVDTPIENMGKNELKMNAFNLIAFEYLDIAYERNLNDESSIGISVLFGLDKDEYGIDDLRRNFSITPYYRQFFGKKYAKGFFVEAFSMIHSSEDNYYTGYNEMTGESIYVNDKFTALALGISAGGKFVTKNGFISEIYFGIGRNLINGSDAVEPSRIVARGGVSLGYRF